MAKKLTNIVSITTVAEIQKRIDAMPAAMSAKGKRIPDVEFSIVANAESRIALKSAKPGARWADDWHWIKGETPTDMLNQADAWIAALPSVDEVRRNEFLTALSDVIELGRQNGIEVDFINPLQETMKRLSENALVDMRVAA